MLITIITPSSTNTVPAAWVEFTTPQGNFVIQEGHAPMVATISSEHPVIVGLADGTNQPLLFLHALIEITRTNVTILAQYK